jgi:predicted alpha/beta-hydrolase family hydrolase
MHYLTDGPTDATRRLILAHGAGEGPESPFLTDVTQGLASSGVCVTRFAFPYMAEMASGGPRRPPDPTPVLLGAWREVIADVLGRGAGSGGLAIGGKSLGGRMASVIAEEMGAIALVCLGYPFHPPGRPERLRTEHLAGLRTPTLICQGTRDPFGRPDEVAGYRLSPAIRLAWIADGDHSLAPRKASGRTWEANLDQVVREVLVFLRSV